MTTPSKVSSVQKRLNREYRRAKKLGGWRTVTQYYSDLPPSMNPPMNVSYVYNLAVKGIVPVNDEVCYRLGLKQRPKPEWLKVAVKFLREREIRS